MNSLRFSTRCGVWLLLVPYGLFSLGAVEAVHLALAHVCHHIHHDHGGHHHHHGDGYTHDHGDGPHHHDEPCDRGIDDCPTCDQLFASTRAVLIDSPVIVEMDLPSHSGWYRTEAVLAASDVLADISPRAPPLA